MPDTALVLKAVVGGDERLGLAVKIPHPNGVGFTRPDGALMGVNKLAERPFIQSSTEQEMPEGSEQGTTVVIGGASGIGRACAERCANLGQRVVIWDIAAE